MFPKDTKSQQLLAAYNANDPDPRIGTFLNKTKNSLCAVYDFSVEGGAIATLPLLDDMGNPAILPQGAIVTNVVCNVITALASAGSATLALGSGNSGATTDLLGATAKASLASGLVAGVPVGTAATSVGPLNASAAGCQVQATIAVATLTAGKIYFNIDYWINSIT